MLVSAQADARLRSDVASGRRPAPEYLRLESHYGVQLLDWSQLGFGPGHRSLRRSLKQVRAALGRLRDVDVVLSDGEHIGIPLALAMRATGTETPHVVIGHHLVTPVKAQVLQHFRADRRMDRVLVHSKHQLASIVSRTGLRAEQLAVVPYGVDTSFWSPGGAECEDEQLIVSAGREHRDYRALVAAVPGNAKLAIADHSLFTPDATRRDPDVWPGNVERLALPPTGLRDLYRRASIVVVPVIESTMPAGITTLLEAMAMGKAIVVTETAELRGVVEHGRSGLTVAPGDVAGLRAAIQELLAAPSLRRTLGARARQVAAERYDVDVYAAALARHLGDVATPRAAFGRV